ncbi:hypothetical protein FA95DRAFT_1461908, partial [Auriscalpium vulgare]
VTRAYPERSVYTLDLPSTSTTFPTFHASLLRPFHPNDADTAPSRVLGRPGPVLTADGEEEWEIEDIIDERRRGRGVQYLVRWKNWGDEDAQWLPSRELQDCAALDRWLQ